jgi:DNA-formamidopyrimidine glycosylase
VPEGHTLHRIALEHRRLFIGQVIRASSPQGRFADGAALLDGRVLTGVEAYGKHLFHRFDGLGDRLHVHLGLYGTFVSGTTPAPDPRGALRLRMIADGHYVDLRGPTRCELLTTGERKALLARLGPDPLRSSADPTPAQQRILRSKTAIGAMLMDQAVLAGVGNVYRAEVLFRAGIAPTRPGSAVSELEFVTMWTDLRSLMRAGVRAGRIVTTAREHREHRRGPARDDERHYVYRRTDLPCRICGTPIRSAEMAARRVYWCPRCQAR